jgi:TPR repeat protein
MVSLGELHASGKLGAADFQKAREWLERGAVAGNAQGMYDLGAMYQNGDGVPKDESKSATYLEKAAEAGHVKAMCQTGVRYIEGTGVARNPTKGLEWLEKATALGDADALAALARIFGQTKGFGESSKGIEALARGDVAGRAGKHAEAVAEFKQSAEAGNAVAMLRLGTACAEGRGLEKNVAKAIEWYQSAIEAGNSEAMVRMGFCITRGARSPRMTRVPWCYGSRRRKPGTLMA